MIMRGAHVKGAQIITPDDGADIPTLMGQQAQLLYVGGTGNIRATLPYGQIVTFNALPVGLHPIYVTKVRATGTTATNILGCVSDTQ